MVGDVEEENSRLANMKLSLEDSCEQVRKRFFFIRLLTHSFTKTLNTDTERLFDPNWSQFQTINISMCSFVFKVKSNILDKTNDIKQLREQIRKLDERLNCEMQVQSTQKFKWKDLYWQHQFSTDSFVVETLHPDCQREFSVCFCVGAGPRGTRLGRRDGVSWESSETSWEEGELWLRRGCATAEGSAATVSYLLYLLLLSVQLLTAGTRGHYKAPSFSNVRKTKIVWCFGSLCWFFLRYHLVLQETNEERRTVANNLASVFTTAANHLSIIEVILLYLFISSPIVYLMYTVKKKKGINAI